VYSNGEVMLEGIHQKAPPNVLVMDREMPGVSGIEVCR
jgi:CheY-like chemotaxis protein